jgi:methyl-accepting chemotaxis protein
MTDTKPRPVLLQRSLTAQGVALVLVVTAGAAWLIGQLAAHWMAARLTRELDQRGSSVAVMLERNKDLHGAALRRDADAAQQVLELAVSSDVEMEYAALLDPRGRPIAAAARGATDAHSAVAPQLAHHPLDTPGIADSDARIRRFTQAVAADEGEKGVWAGADERLYNAGTTIGYLVLGMRDRSAALAQGHMAVTVAGVGAALATTFLLFFLALARRLRRIVRFAEQLADRDLAADLPDGAPDEVGRVVGALCAIRDTTREVVSDLATAADALRSSSIEVHRSAQGQRDRTEGQARRISEIGSTLAELERSAGTARDGAEAVIRSGVASGRDAEEGRRAVAGSTEAVETLRERVTSAAEALRQLLEQSASIDEIAVTVEDLAEQSNVLAINATIEAASAGEAGRPFRVIAVEMRELAVASRTATGRVREMLLEIARAAERSRATTASGHQSAEVAVERARGATRAIEGLSSTVTAFVETASGIAASAREQASAIEEISARMGDVKSEAEGAAASIAALEEASRDILVRAERLRAVVENYRGRAQRDPSPAPLSVSSNTMLRAGSERDRSDGGEARVADRGRLGPPRKASK